MVSNELAVVESNEIAVRKLMHACDKDPALFDRLVEHPDEVAAKFGVTLAKEDLEQLKRVQKLHAIIDEFKANRPVVRGPSRYPIDIAWKSVVANHIIFYRPSFYPIFYPPWDRAIRNHEVLSASKIPWWKWGFYPAQWEKPIADVGQVETQIVRR